MILSKADTTDLTSERKLLQNTMPLLSQANNSAPVAKIL